MKEVASQGRQRMLSEAGPLPVHLPSRRRLMMQQLERHADFDQVHEAPVEHYIDNDHSLHEDFADDRSHQKLANPHSLLLHAKYASLAAPNNRAYNENHLENFTDEDPHEAASNHYADHLQQQQSTAADHHQKRGPHNVSVLHAKYGLSDPSYTPYSDHHSDRYVEDYTDDDHLVDQEIAAEHGSRTAPATLKATQSHRAHNSHPHDTHTERSSIGHQQKQQDYKADQYKGSRIAKSTLQAAQAQAAELRALHSAMLDNYSFTDQNTAAHKNYPHKERQEEALFLKSRPKKASKKKSKLYSEEDQIEEVRNRPLSSTSSASSTADCFIRPAHEYPLFMPSHEDTNSTNRRNSIDNHEALMREERLNYIFDHDNKRSFSGMQYTDRSKRDRNNVSCLHESLNLPPRSASTLVHLQGKDDHLPLHHMSLNLPPGSQHHLFNTTSYKQNPLFDHFNHSDKKASYQTMDALDGSSYSSSIKRLKDSKQHSAGLNKSMDQYAYDVNAAFTGRQRALLEFLSEEPARMRAFNELAAMPEIAPQYVDEVQVLRNSHKDAPALAEDNLSSSRRVKGAYESAQNAHHFQGSSDHHLRHQTMPYPSHSTTGAPRAHQKSAHTSNGGHSDKNSGGTGISFDVCRPVAGAHTGVVALTDSRDLSADHAPANAAVTAPKEKPDQKRPSIKGWFFRGKKKHNNVDSSNVSQASPADFVSASKDRTPITSSSTFTSTQEKQSNSSLMTAKEKQSSASTTSTTVATNSSHVYSSLINSEAEKQLEVAMAMDLMELKVLQANTKRDAAMAEVIELRLTMDSMAKKLVEVERHCEALRTQLLDAKALHRHDDQMFASHPKSAPATEIMINAASVDSDDPGAEEIINAEEADQYESDSIDHREERRPSKGISTIRAGLVAGYGGRSSSKCVQPTKAEFLNAVAEARVGIRQVSRVLLQHIQESKGAGTLWQTDHGKAGRGADEEEAAGGMAADDQQQVGAQMKKGRERSDNWGPIMIMCREAAKEEQKTGMISGSRGRGVAYCVEALISMAFHENFENVGFDKNGAHKILDPSQRALAFYHSFLKLAKLTPTQLLTQPSPLYNSAFDHFCSRKMRSLGRAVGCPGKLWPDELARTFLAAARALWLLHHLAFAYHGRPPGIFRVAAQSSFDSRFMEVLPSDYRHVSVNSNLLVSLMVMPGFFLPDDIIKCKVLAS